MMSNGNIKCSTKIDGFVGQQQNINKTGWAGIKANGLELFFCFLKLCFSAVPPINAGDSTFPSSV